MEVIVRTDVEEVEVRRGLHFGSIWKGWENLLAEKRKRSSAHSSPWGRRETWMVRSMLHDTVPWRLEGYAALGDHTSGLQGLLTNS